MFLAPRVVASCPPPWPGGELPRRRPEGARGDGSNRGGPVGRAWLAPPGSSRCLGGAAPAAPPRGLAAVAAAGVDWPGRRRGRPGASRRPEGPNDLELGGRKSPACFRGPSVGPGDSGPLGMGVTSPGAGDSRRGGRAGDQRHPCRGAHVARASCWPMGTGGSWTATPIWPAGRAGAVRLRDRLAHGRPPGPADRVGAGPVVARVDLTPAGAWSRRLRPGSSWPATPTWPGLGGWSGRGGRRNKDRDYRTDMSMRRDDLPEEIARRAEAAHGWPGARTPSVWVFGGG